MRFVKMNKFKLGGLLDATRGASLSGEHYATSGRLKRLTLANFDYANNGFKEDTSKDNLFYEGDVAEKFILRKGDIITPLTEQTPGLLGTTAMIPESGTYIQSQDVCLLKPFPKQLDSKFAYYLVSSKCVKEQLAARSQQTKIRHSSPDKIKDCVVFVPDLPIQERIGRLLFAIDTKIALNRKKIEKLEALAKTIYDYWFVQFDFPDANGRPYKSSGGKMVYNPILKREIPDGWEVLPFAQCIDFTMGQSPSGETLNETNKGTLFYQGATDFGDYFPTPRQYTTLPVRKAMPGDVLLSVRAPVGTVNIADDECCIGRGVGAFRRRGNAKRGLLVWFHLKSLAPYFDRKNNAGTTFGAIGKEDFLLLSVPKPSDSLIERYENMTFNMSRQMLTLHKEIRNLTNLRDFLLPLLMNGQVEVGE